MSNQFFNFVIHAHTYFLSLFDADTQLCMIVKMEFIITESMLVRFLININLTKVELNLKFLMICGLYERSWRGYLREIITKK
jgi:hypothetical protein